MDSESFNEMEVSTIPGMQGSSSSSGASSKRLHLDDDEYRDDGGCKKAKFASDIHTEMRILIASKDAGAVIGKGGTNIKKLRQSYNACVTLPDSDGPERIVTISTSLGNACSILLDVLINLNVGNDEETSMRFLIHQSQAGAVIGKSGSKIKELRETCQAVIKVYGECAPGSTERVIEIAGCPETIATTILAIIEFLQSAPPLGPNYPYDPMNFDESYASEYGGYTIYDNRPTTTGRNQPPKKQGNFSGTRGRFSPRASGATRGRGAGKFGSSPPYGPQSYNQRGDNYAYNHHDGDNYRYGHHDSDNSGYGTQRRGGAMRGQFQRPSMRGPRGGGYGPGPRGSGGHSQIVNEDIYDDYGYKSFEDETQDISRTASIRQDPLPVDADTEPIMFISEDVEVTQVSIPTDLTGSIIGRGGMRIKQIRAESGASITIDEPLPGAADRIINIKGSPNQIQNAQYLLQMSVKKFSGKY